jgi:hypothetical protein
VVEGEGEGARCAASQWNTCAECRSERQLNDRGVERQYEQPYAWQGPRVFWPNPGAWQGAFGGSVQNHEI